MLAVVIPSRTFENVRQCMLAINVQDPELEQVFIVDDGINWPTKDRFGRILEGRKPFIFSRNINIAIEFGLKHWQRLIEGFVILNDDALLQTPGGFSLLAQAARENPEYGVIAAVTNSVGNPNQLPQGVGLREDPRMVCFVCVYIPRNTIENVGLLDERYVGYGMDDDDYCLRVRNAGLKVGIHDGCVVDHGSLKSTYRGDGKVADFHPNLELFKQKWGHDNWSVPV